MTRLYVGGLSWDTTEETLRAAFGGDGRSVTGVNIKRNATSGKPRGFAFVDMGSDTEAESATAALNGSTLDGKQIKVGAAKELRSTASAGHDHSGSYGGSRGRGGRRW